MSDTWYGNGCDEELLAFLGVCYAMSIMGAETLLYALEKPWKYTRVYEAWVKLGRPIEGDSVALSAFYVTVRDMKGEW